MIALSLGLDAKDVERLLADVNAGVVGDALGEAMHSARLLVSARAMATVHVVTGNLRRSLSEGGLAMTGRAGDFAARAVVGSNTIYAPVEEYGGTIRVPAHSRRTPSGGRASVREYSYTREGHPYLTPAVQSEMPAVRSLIVRRLAAVLRAQGGA